MLKEQLTAVLRVTASKLKQATAALRITAPVHPLNGRASPSREATTRQALSLLTVV